MSFSLLGAKVPVSEFHGAKVPESETSGNESSRKRKFHLWNFRSRKRKYVGTKVPVTLCRVYGADCSARKPMYAHKQY